MLCGSSVGKRPSKSLTTARLPSTPPLRCRTARVAFTDSATLVGWSLMYLAVGVAMWWPAVVVSVVLLVVGHRKGRQAAATYADLVESVFDVHGTDLAEALRIPTGDSLTPPVGHVISERLRKGT